MKKIAAFLLVLFCIGFTLTGCSTLYDKTDFLGKTSAEIIDKYGPFDCVTMPLSEDGLYKNCRCGYTIEEASENFFEPTAERLFFIVFDEKGIAIECEEGCRPGG